MKCEQYLFTAGEGRWFAVRGGGNIDLSECRPARICGTIDRNLVGDGAGEAR